METRPGKRHVRFRRGSQWRPRVQGFFYLQSFKRHHHNNNQNKQTNKNEGLGVVAWVWKANAGKNSSIQRCGHRNAVSFGGLNVITSGNTMATANDDKLNALYSCEETHTTRRDATVSQQNRQRNRKSTRAPAEQMVMTKQYHAIVGLHHGEQVC